MDEAPAPSKPYSRRACVECKSKKIRCLPSRQSPNICHRCYERGHECLVPETRQRQPPKRLRNRMDQLEQNLGGLMALLSSNQLPTSPEAGNASNRTPTSLSVSVHSSPNTANNSHPHHDLFDHGLVSLDQAEALVHTFRRMSEQNFLYVTIPKTIGVPWLRNERPMLLQAVLTVASWRDRPLQLALETEYLKALGSRFFVKGEKSLDILQGILVYLGWYHFHVTPPVQQTYRLASLAVIMLVDLGLDKKPQAPSEHEMIVESRIGSINVAPTVQAPPSHWTNDAKRAILGAYAISTFSSVLVGKKKILEYSPYLEDCAMSLTNEKEIPSDAILLYYVRLLRIADEVYTIFDFGDRDTYHEMTDDRVQACLRVFEGQMNAWRASLPPEVTNNFKLQTWACMFDAYIHEVGLYGHLQGQPLSATRVSILFDCLARLRKYITLVLSCTLEDMQTWTGWDWRLLKYATMLGTKASVVVDSAASNSESANRVAKMDSYLSYMVERLRELYKLTGTPEGQPHFFDQMAQQYENVRIWYRGAMERTVAERCAEQTPEQQLSQCTDQAQIPAMPNGGFNLMDAWGDNQFWPQTGFGPANFMAEEYPMYDI